MYIWVYCPSADVWEVLGYDFKVVFLIVFCEVGVKTTDGSFVWSVRETGPCIFLEIVWSGVCIFMIFGGGFVGFVCTIFSKLIRKPDGSGLVFRTESKSSILGRTPSPRSPLQPSTILFIGSDLIIIAEVSGPT